MVLRACCGETPWGNTADRDRTKSRGRNGGIWVGLVGAVGSSVLAIAAPPVLAQATPGITAANDGTGTQVQTQTQPQGTTYQITGGTQVQQNLFHSFGDFNLQQGETAQFIPPSTVENVLGRITSGNPSEINGSLSLVGSGANLYLINPAGILFGAGAHLNVPASFTATTATGITFQGGTFSSFGPNGWATLGGSPQGLLFGGLGDAGAIAGTIVNTGQLQVTPGAQLQLVGGQVINTGTLTAAGGTVGLLAVAEPGTVRLSATGSILGFDLQDPALASALDPNHAPVSFNPLDLPQLLTGGTIDHATALVIEGEGRVFLQGSPSSLAGGAGSLAVAGTVSVARGTGAGGTIDLLGQRVMVGAATIAASGGTGGGSVRIGGDYQGQGALPRSQTTWISADSQIAADALGEGSGGRVIVWADGTTSFQGQISAEGGELGGDGGFVEVSGAQQLIFQGEVSTAAPQGQRGTLLLDPTDIEIVADPTIATALTAVDDFGDSDQGIPTQIRAGLLNNTSNNLILKANRDIFFNATLHLAPGVSLTAEANNSIFINRNITTQGGNLTLRADADNNGVAKISGGGAAIVTQGGRVSLKATGEVWVGSIDTTSPTGQGGAITITQGAGRVNPFRVGGAGDNGSVGLITSGNYTVPPGSYPTSIALTAKGLQSGLLEVGTNPNINLVAAINSGSFTLDPNDPPSQLDLQPLNSAPSRSGAIGSSQPLQPNMPSSRQSDPLNSGGSDSPLKLEGNGFGSTGEDPGRLLGGPTGLEGRSDSSASPGPTDPNLPPRPNLQTGANPPNQPTQRPTATRPQGPQIPPPPPFSQFPADRRLDRSADGLKFDRLERDFLADISARFGPPPIPGNRDSAVQQRLTLSQSQQALRSIQSQTNITPAVVYFRFSPSRVTANQDGNPATTLQEQDSDELELLLITPNGQPLRRQIPGASRARVSLALRRFRQDIADPVKASQNQHQYRRPAQLLYNWMIQPLEETLAAEGVENILFFLDAGLRSLPLAALYDGEQFLIEKYSLGLSPSLSLTDLRYRDVREVDLLAMGASEFLNQNPLPTVPVEVGTISDLWPRNSVTLLNENFTRQNLIAQRQTQGQGIIHLATHAEFQGGDLSNSYIQFYGDDRVSFNQLRELGLSDPPVELLTLSACQTALGNPEAELGFAGLAIQAGVKTALASLWSVSDAATAALMTRFYSNLTEVPIKAAALRQAQLSMLRGEVVLEGNRLRGARGGTDVELPASSVAGLPNQALTHPFYWAPFTLVGSPW